MDIVPVKDRERIKECLRRPGMAKLCRGGIQSHVSLEDEVDAIPHLFLECLLNGVSLGFTSLTDVGGGNALIHVMLRSKGDSTVEAVRKTLDYGKSLGLNKIHAIYPSNRRAVKALAERTGFAPVGHLTIQGIDFIHESIDL